MRPWLRALEIRATAQLVGVSFAFKLFDQIGGKKVSRFSRNTSEFKHLPVLAQHCGVMDLICWPFCQGTRTGGRDDQQVGNNCHER
jgi:hypothetical protein